MAPNPSVNQSEESDISAIVILEDYEGAFSQYLNTPKFLIPLGNRPLIDYTLEFLAGSGVSKVSLYSNDRHCDSLETYIHSSKWHASAFKDIKVRKCLGTSVGDVMRDVDQQDFIKTDFVVVSGDIVTNVTLEDALRAHKARREKSKDAVMTMLLRQDWRRRGQKGPKATFVVEPLRSRCLHYEEVSPGAKLEVDRDILKQPEIDIRQDLFDCRIDICSPDVLGLWTDNFDQKLPRKEYLYNALKDYELNGKTFHTHIFRDQYAARASSVSAYNSMRQDFRKRRAYPYSHAVPSDRNSKLDYSIEKIADDYAREDAAQLAEAKDYTDYDSSAESESEQEEIVGDLNGDADEFDDDEDLEVADNKYHEDAVNGLYERMQENADPKNIRPEFISARLAANATDNQVRKALAAALMKHICTQIDKGRPMAGTANGTLKKWQEFITMAAVTKDEQSDFLTQIQQDLSLRSLGDKIMPFVVKDLYDLEIFPEEALLAWRASADDNAVKAAAEPFFAWLEDAESEGDEDGDDEDSDE